MNIFERFYEKLRDRDLEENANEFNSYFFKIEMIVAFFILSFGTIIALVFMVIFVYGFAFIILYIIQYIVLDYFREELANNYFFKKTVSCTFYLIKKSFGMCYKCDEINLDPCGEDFIFIYRCLKFFDMIFFSVIVTICLSFAFFCFVGGILFTIFFFVEFCIREKIKETRQHEDIAIEEEEDETKLTEEEENIRKQIELIGEKNVNCVICLEKPPQYYYRNCGHVVYCKNCCKQIRRCPVCRQRGPISQLFFS
jgi:hypothetical protein